MRSGSMIETGGDPGITLGTITGEISGVRAIDSSLILNGRDSSVSSSSSSVLDKPAKSDVLDWSELCGRIDSNDAEGGGVISNSPSTKGSSCVSIEPEKDIIVERIFPAIVGVVLMNGLYRSGVDAISENTVVEDGALVCSLFSSDCSTLLSSPTNFIPE